MTRTFEKAYTRRVASQEHEATTAERAELFERFRDTPTKIAIQKDGELTDISRSILADIYGIFVPPKPKGPELVSVSECGTYGFLHARNKSICDLVANGAVDMAVVGTDRLVEDGAENKVDIVASYPSRGLWSLVLATPADSPINSPDQIHRVATQYPVITRRFFDSIQGGEVEIVSTAGSTEMYPYLDYGATPVDCVIDLTVTGSSLAAHNLVPWTPSIGDVYPVVIQKKTNKGV
jgi:ATP phosphoribosyltransferase